MAQSLSIEVQDLKFAWTNQDKPLINIANLTVAKRESLFIYGASGSGKSSLLNLFSGVATPTEGLIKLLDKPFSNLKTNQKDQFRSDHIGYIFQQFNLLPYLSVLENVLMPTKLSEKRRSNSITQNGDILEEAKHWLMQLNIPPALHSKTVLQLSIGQQQRVAAARALMGSPELIIADEPTSALDADNVENFMSVLVNQCKASGSSLVFVSHDQALKKYFDASYELSRSHEHA